LLFPEKIVSARLKIGHLLEQKGSNAAAKGVNTAVKVLV
jgi:hypothetical protein